MNELSIAVDGNVTSFLPRDTISGQISWHCTSLPSSLELRLFWYTKGRGTQDVQIVETRAVEQPPMSGSQSFSFKRPEEPVSLSGKLVSLLWALELAATPGHEVFRVDLVVSPTRHEIVISVIEPQPQ